MIVGLLQFIASPVGATIAGSLLKLIANWLNGNQEQKLADSARSRQAIELQIRLQQALSNDEFAKRTRRWVFWPLTWSYCVVFIYFAIQGDAELILPMDKKTGLVSWLFGGPGKEAFRTTGTYVVYSGIQLIHMIVGFYATPNKGGR